MMNTPSSLHHAEYLRFKQISISADTVIDLWVAQKGLRYSFAAMEWTVKDGGASGGGAYKVPEEEYDSSADAIARFDQYVAAWA